jgi:hypothetical protein
MNTNAAKQEQQSAVIYARASSDQPVQRYYGLHSETDQTTSALKKIECATAR